MVMFELRPILVMPVRPIVMGIFEFGAIRMIRVSPVVVLVICVCAVVVVVMIGVCPVPVVQGMRDVAVRRVIDFGRWGWDGAWALVGESVDGSRACSGGACHRIQGGGWRGV